MGERIDRAARTRKGWRIGVGAAIAGFWLVMMALLWQRELGPPRLLRGASPLAAAAPVVPSDSWLGVYVAAADGGAPGVGEERIGHLHLEQLPEARHGAAGSLSRLAARLRLNLLGQSTDLELDGTVWRALAEPRAEIDFAVRSESHDVRIVAKVAGGALTGEVRSAGESFPLDLPVGGDVLFDSGLGAAFELPRLEVGEAVRLDTFDPLTLRPGTARVECLAQETLTVAGAPLPVRRLAIDAGGVRSQAWIDETGAVVRAETPFGLVLQRISAAEAGVPVVTDAAAADAAGGLLERTAVVPTGARPFRGARALTVVLAGVDDDRDGGDAPLVLGRRRLTMPAPPGLGASVAGAPPAALAADPFIQADHPEIRSRAAAIVGEEPDPWERVRLLHDWVYAALDKVPVASIPSALAVLRERRGDCNEHAVLFAALARAAGVPTRVAVGVVWSDELAGFYYHAWPEVFLEGRWIAVDPTLDQLLADATHVKLLTGGVASWPRLVPYLGRLTIEVQAVE